MNDIAQQLQRIEQSLQQLIVQKQGVQAQLIEIESALEELDGEESAWRMVGNILVKKDGAALAAELNDRKERVKQRVGAVEEQESRLRAKAQELQKSLMEHTDGSGKRA